MELLERDGERQVLEAALEESRAAGRVVVVVGEAGIGKTSLVGAACEAARERRVLWGACDPLVTPRPLGPLRDVARQAGGPLALALAGAGPPRGGVPAAPPRPAPRPPPGGRRRGPPPGRRPAPPPRPPPPGRP